MDTYRITALGEGREIYEVEGESAEEVRERFENGEITHPVLTEISGSDIEDIELIDE